MTPDEFLLCSQPITSSTDVTGFELYQFGTCFIARYADRHWVIAATHSLAQHGKRDDRLLIPRGEQRLDGLGLGTGIEMGSSHPEDTAFADITVFEVAEPLGHEPELVAFDFDKYAFVHDWDSLQRGDDVILSGYPQTGLENGIDYERREVKRQRFKAQGHYLGPTSSQFMHKIQIEMGRVTEMNGMSGSPIFLSRHGLNRWAFAGMLLRGNGEGLAQFVDCRAVLYVIWKHEKKQRPSEASAP
ncbi:MAG TPA: hypothetical protein VII82_02170 [Polyangiaceae bacterium]